MEISKENKFIKKSTINQLQALLNFMEENPEFARGAPVFGKNKLKSEEQWIIISRKLNSMGPPSRTIAEWKKTWADLKSRTKKKISDNKKSLNQTGGGLYRNSNLTELEIVIDRILFLSSAAATSGTVFGFQQQSLDTATTTQTVQQQHLLQKQQPHLQQQQQLDLPQQQQPHLQQQQQHLPQPNQQKRGAEHLESCLNSDLEQPTSSSVKKRKTLVENQLNLIRRQLRVSKQSCATLIEQANNIKKLADAAQRSADAAEATAASLKSMEKLLQQLLTKLEK